jgi:hypothetical protein
MTKHNSSTPQVATGDGDFCEDIAHAQLAILRHVIDDERDAGLPEKQLVIGYRFKYQLFKDLVDGIEDLRKQGKDIQFVRIYQSKTERGTVKEQQKKNVVVTPVLGNDDDYYELYQHPLKDKAATLVIFNGTPCPNVCQKDTIFCLPKTKNITDQLELEGKQ